MVSKDHNHQPESAKLATELAADVATEKREFQGVTGTLTSRSIRSFVIRNGRLTGAQQSALDKLLPEFGIPFSESKLDFASVFKRSAPIWVEIGFGNGDALLHMAKHYPGVDVIGIEVHAPGVGQALLGIQAEALTNLRIIQHDAIEVLQHMIAEQTLDRVLLFFPDPWHKKRHQKRRIVQAEFLQAVSSRLKSGGLLHCATDVADYAQWMLEHLDNAKQLHNESPNQDFVAQPEWRINTRFERRGQKLGHDVFDLLYRRT